MIEEQLEQYIEEARARGHTDREIRGRLISVGWHPNKVYSILPIEEKKNLRVYGSILAVLAVLIVIMIAFIRPSSTGFIIYQGEAAVWDFSSPEEYIFNSSKIQVSNGAQLIKYNKTTTWEEEVTRTSAITAAVYDRKDKLSKVDSEDNEWLSVDKDKIFDVTFNHSLTSRDMIRLYLEKNNTEDLDIYICEASTSCDSPGYGLIHFDGTEGWYEIILSGISSPASTFNLDPDKVKVDYIGAQYTEIIEHTNTSEVFPSSSAIETDDAIVEGSWGTFSAVSILKGQSINYYYSTDSGSSWTAVYPGDDLSSVESNTLRFKAELNSDGSATPILTSMAIGYSEGEVSYSLILNLSNDQIEIVTSEPTSESEIIVEEFTNSSVSNSAASPVNKYLSINGSQINHKLLYSIIRIYYTDDEISSLDESTLRIYYLSGDSWIVLDSIVVEEENYVWAKVTHFSTYGLFGEQLPAEAEEPEQPGGTAPSGSSGGGRGSGSHISESPVEEAQPHEEGPEVGVVEETLAEEVAQEEAETEVAGAVIKATSKRDTNMYSLLAVFAIVVVVGIVAYIRRKR